MDAAAFWLQLGVMNFDVFPKYNVLRYLIIYIGSSFLSLGDFFFQK